MFNLSLHDKCYHGFEEVKGDPWNVLAMKRDELLKKRNVN